MGLDSVELLFRAEREFGVEIPNDIAETITTVEDFAKAFVRMGVSLPYPEIEGIIIWVIHETQGIPIEKIKPHHRLSADLGID